MGQIMKKEDLACKLAETCGFYKKNMREVVSALPDIILEQLQTATFDQDAEIHLMPGLVIGGRRVPAREAKDPRTGEVVLSPEKVIPYATFKQTLRLKLYKKPKGYKKKTKKV
jgi:nucleoid DNA-binding protein